MQNTLYVWYDNLVNNTIRFKKHGILEWAALNYCVMFTDNTAKPSILSKYNKFHKYVPVYNSL